MADTSPHGTCQRPSKYGAEMQCGNRLPCSNPDHAPHGSTGVEPSAEAIWAARRAMSALAVTEQWSPNAAAIAGLKAAYAIDAPAIHASGVAEGRAAAIVTVIEVLMRLGCHAAADAIEAAFPTTGETTDD